MTSTSDNTGASEVRALLDEAADLRRRRHADRQRTELAEARAHGLRARLTRRLALWLARRVVT